MAETKEVKKRAPRKPKTATEVVAEAPLEVNEITVPKEEDIAKKVEEIADPEEKSLETNEEIAEKEEEIAEKEEKSPEISDEGTQLPEDITPFEEFKAPEVPEPEITKKEVEPKDDIDIPAGAAKIKKLNPYLEDFQSKWFAVVVSKTGQVHKFFKGSYAKAYNAAENYNISHGFGKGNVAKIRK